MNPSMYWFVVQVMSQINPSTYSVISWVGTIVISGIVNTIIGAYFVGKYKQTVDDLHTDLDKLRYEYDALEAAFVSHTGMTINGKSYRTGDMR